MSDAATAPIAARPAGVVPHVPQHSNAYNIFILVLTVASLVVMVLLVLPLDPDTLSILRVYDNLICVVFLLDFAWNIRHSRPRSYYFVHQRGWLDLLGSIPSFGFFPAAGLFRLFRLSRLARISRLLRDGSAVEKLRASKDAAALYAVLTEGETSSHAA